MTASTSAFCAADISARAGLEAKPAITPAPTSAATKNGRNRRAKGIGSLQIGICTPDSIYRAKSLNPATMA